VAQPPLVQEFGPRQLAALVLTGFVEPPAAMAQARLISPRVASPFRLEPESPFQRMSSRSDQRHPSSPSGCISTVHLLGRTARLIQTTVTGSNSAWLGLWSPQRQIVSTPSGLKCQPRVKAVVTPTFSRWMTSPSRPRPLQPVDLHFVLPRGFHVEHLE
jgi:hypothetical protein